MSLKTWFLATRPWSLVMTFVSTCLAGILAYASDGFSIPIFLLTMLGLIIAHISANMTNDWYDVKHGIDENAPTSQYRPHPLLHGELDKSTYKKVIIGLYSFGLIIALYLTLLRGIPVLIFTILGVLFGVFYTADPILLKHRSVGEISTFLAFGPLMVGGAYYALTGKLDLEPMIASTPIGLLVALVLLSNNLRDKDYDASVGIKTLTTNQDIRTGLTYFKILLASAYIATILLIVKRTLSPFSFLTFLTLKEALKIVKNFNVDIPFNSDQITAQLALHYGVLLTIGEFINIIYVANF
jgi:1,4-dihydroxy-2-naphthoate octaprenyltransferase